MGPAIELLLIVGVAFLGLLALLAVFARAERLAITTILATEVLGATPLVTIPLKVDLASFTVTASDVFTVLLGCVALYRTGWTRIVPPARGAAIAIAVMVAVGLIAWVVQLGPQPAVNYWRGLMLALAGLWYAASSPRLHSPAGLRPFVWVALFASLVQVFAYVKYGFLGYSTTQTALGEDVSGRPVYSTSALLMLMAVVIVVTDQRLSLPVKIAVGSWLTAAILLASHRSVWVAGLAVAFLMAAHHAMASRNRFLGATLGVLVLAAMAVGLRVLLATPELEYAATNTGTLMWRFENWVEKLSTPRSPGQWLVGSMFGPTPLTNPIDSTLTFQVAAHNMMIDVVTQLGLVGLVLWAVLAVTSVIRPLRMGVPVLWLCASANLVFGLFYDWTAWSWLLLGVILAVGVGRRRFLADAEDPNVSADRARAAASPAGAPPAPPLVRAPIG